MENVLSGIAPIAPTPFHENGSIDLEAVFKEGGVIASDRIRHPLRPLSARTKERLISLARDLDIIALKWGH